MVKQRSVEDCGFKYPRYFNTLDLTHFFPLIDKNLMKLQQEISKCLDYYSFIVRQKSDSVSPPTLSFLYNSVLPSLSSLHFHIIFKCADIF